MTESALPKVSLDHLFSNLPQHFYELLVTPRRDTLTLVYASEAALRFLGRDASDASTLPITLPVARLLELIHPQDVGRIIAQLAEGAQTFAACQGQCRLWRPDTTTPASAPSSGTGRECWIGWRAEPARESDDVVRWRVILTEMTALKRAEARFSADVERLTLASHVGGIGVWEIDVVRDRLTWDARMYELFGISPQSFGHRQADWTAMIHPDDRDEVLRRRRATVETGAHFDMEYRIVRPAGEVGYIHSISRVLQDVNGEPERALGIAWDITEDMAREMHHRRLAEALTLETERLTLAVRAGGVGIWEVVFADRRFTWDDQMHALYGFAPGTFGGTIEEWADLLHADDVERVLAEWERAIAETSVFDTEFRIRHASSGRTCFVRALAHVIRGPDGTALRAVGTNWDVTIEREAAEAMRLAKETAEAAERAKSEFLAVMSHEIRTPMNTVLGMTRLALQTGLTPRQRNYLNKIDLSARGLIVILNDILDFSKIEAGKMVLEETEFAIESLLESVAAVTAIKAEEKGLEIAFAVAPGVPTHIVGDPLRLGQVLINLLNNAVKFTEQGDVVASIGLDPAGRALRGAADRRADRAGADDGPRGEPRGRHERASHEADRREPALRDPAGRPAST